MWSLLLSTCCLVCILTSGILWVCPHNFCLHSPVCENSATCLYEWTLKALVHTLNCIRLLVHREKETKCIEKAVAVLAAAAVVVEERWGGDELQPASPRRAGSGGAAPRHRAAFVRVIILTLSLRCWNYLVGRVADTLAPPFTTGGKLSL